MKNIKSNNEILKRVQDDENKILRFAQDDKNPLASAKPRVAIAMSGGVDSSVAAKILVDQGFEVVGFMMKLWSDPTCPSVCPRENACCDDQGVMDAKKVADQIGIPFYVVNAKEVFKKEVVDYFIDEYKNLRTPNPCLVCNEKIKFGWLLDFAKKTGCEYLATGHYVRIVDDSDSNQLSVVPTSPRLRRAGSCQNSNTTFHLLKGRDENKDQSYFMYKLNQNQLSKIIFPVGELKKEEVRALAKKWKLPVFEKRESQEICFIQDKDFRDFLKRNIPSKYFKPGDIIDKEGNILGKHEGLINYTIGQRKGIEQSFGLQNPKLKLQISNKIQNPNDKTPLYVIGFDQKKNQLIVGEDKDIYRDKMILRDIHFVQNTDNRIQITDNLKVKIRYRHEAVDCMVKNTDNSRQITVEFEEKQRAITPGQSAVFYDGDEVLGGGTIQ